MTTIRQQRVAELLFEELSIMIGNELDDPRLSLVRVTNVDVSRDLRNVNVYVAHDDDDLSKRQVLQGLRHATPFLRRQLAVLDELLRQIAASRAEGGENNNAAMPPSQQ
jgi:ribosome-binding factor A